MSPVTSLSFSLCFNRKHDYVAGDTFTTIYIYINHFKKGCLNMTNKNTEILSRDYLASLLTYINSNGNNSKINNTNSSNISPIQMVNSKDLKKYVIPRKCMIPSGKYVSVVMYAYLTLTNSGKDAIAVYYKIRQAPPQPDSNKNKKFSRKTYYIRQLYPDGTKSFNEFLNSMDEALGTKSYTLKDTVGVTEYVTLSYYRKNSIGRYSKRTPITL